MWGGERGALSPWQLVSLEKKMFLSVRQAEFCNTEEEEEKKNPLQHTQTPTNSRTTSRRQSARRDRRSVWRLPADNASSDTDSAAASTINTRLSNGGACMRACVCLSVVESHLYRFTRRT